MNHDVALDLDDAALLLELSKGNKNAFDILYNRYWKLVYNTAYKRLSNTELSEDVSQDVFVQLWGRASQSPIQNLPAYLLIATRNAVFKKMEKEGRYATLPISIEEMESAAGAADSKMVYEDFLKAFNQLVDSLPEQQRSIFKLRFEEDLSTQEIADRLDISVKTVRNQIGKALTTLRSAMLIQFLFLVYSG